jgi:hypothetical protein
MGAFARAMGAQEGMNKNHTDENRMIEQYLANELSESEREAFEERVLYSPALLDELEAAERLQQGLQDVTALEMANASADQPTGRSRSAVVTLFQSPRYAMAASVLLLISLSMSSFLLQQNRHLSPVDGSLPVQTEIIPLVSVRSGSPSDPVNTVNLGDGAHQYVMMLDPGFEEYSHFRTTIYRLEAGGAKSMLWQVDEMTPGYEDMLALSVPGSVLEAGDFEVRVEGWQAGWPAVHEYERVNTLTFRVSDK